MTPLPLDVSISSGATLTSHAPLPAEWGDPVVPQERTLEALAKPAASSLQPQGAQGVPRISGRFLMKLSRIHLLRSQQDNSFFPEVSDGSSEMDEAKSPQDPPSTPAPIMQGMDRDCRSRRASPGAQIQNCLALIQSFSALFLLSLPWGAQLEGFFPHSPYPHGILISQRYYILTYGLCIFVCALYIKRVKFSPRNQFLGNVTTAENSCPEHVLGSLLEVPKLRIRFFLGSQSPCFSHDFSGKTGKRTSHHKHKCNSLTGHK